MREVWCCLSLFCRAKAKKQIATHYSFLGPCDGSPYPIWGEDKRTGPLLHSERRFYKLFTSWGRGEAGPPGEKRKFMTILVRITPVIKQPGLMQKWEEEGEAFLLVCFYCVMQREEFKRENNPR